MDDLKVVQQRNSGQGRPWFLERSKDKYVIRKRFPIRDDPLAREIWAAMTSQEAPAQVPEKPNRQWTQLLWAAVRTVRFLLQCAEWADATWPD